MEFEGFKSAWQKQPVEGLAGVALLAQRLRAPATVTILDFVSRECRQIEMRLRLETYTQRLTVITYAYSMSTLERRLMQKPALFAAVLAASTLLWAASVCLCNRKLRRRGGFINDVGPLRMAEPLNLSH